MNAPRSKDLEKAMLIVAMEAICQLKQGETVAIPERVEIS